MHKQRLGNFAPVRSSNLTLKKNDEPSAYGGGSTDGRADDEAPECLIVPCPTAVHLASERPDVLHGRELECGSGMKPKSRANASSTAGSSVPTWLVQSSIAVQVQSGLVRGVREDMLLEIVGAELRTDEDELNSGFGTRQTSAEMVQFSAYI